MSGTGSASVFIPAEDAVEFLRVDLNSPPEVVAGYRLLLTALEQERADRFVTETLTRRSIVCRGVLRRYLSNRLGVPAAEIRFIAGPHGKPNLAPDYGASLEFNVSHSGNLAVIAAAVGRVVGVDVEAMDESVSRDELATRFFSARERQAYFAISESQRLAAFYRIWTCKEAYLKATGIGLSFPLGQFSVTAAIDEPPGLLHVDERPEEIQRWSFVAPPVGTGHAAALAVEGHGWTLRCGTWDHGAGTGISWAG